MQTAEMYKFNATVAIFDPTNEEHRQIVAEFMETNSWKHTNTRFVIERPYTNVVSMITTKLVKYYASKEFTVGISEVAMRC